MVDFVCGWFLIFVVVVVLWLGLCVSFGFVGFLFFALIKRYLASL